MAGCISINIKYYAICYYSRLVKGLIDKKKIEKKEKKVPHTLVTTLNYYGNSLT